MNNCILLVFLYNLDRLQELDYLCNNTLNFDMYITFGEKIKYNTKIKNFVLKYQNRIINIDFHKNCGVDILPFIKQIKTINDVKYPFFIKLHGKQSKLGRYNHVDWGSILWDSLIGNNTIYHQNLHILSQKHVGTITHNLSILNHREINNSNKIHILCDKFNIDYNKVQNSQFMAGSVFMGKTKLYKDLLTPHIDFLSAYLETECGKVDDREYINGTFCHAMERIFGYIITYKNLKIHGSSLYPVLRLYNSKEKNLYLHTTYNNISYITKDFNLCGKIIQKNKYSLTIEWLHLDNKRAAYKFLDDKIIIRKE